MLREQKSSGFRVSCPVVDPLIGCLTDFVITFSVSGDCDVQVKNGNSEQRLYRSFFDAHHSSTRRRGVTE